VALLTPIPDDDPLERLRAAGDLIPATHPDADFPDPLPIPPGMEPASVVLARLRGNDR
jgi:hypothetical protein